jgi:hypothetical protein
MRTLLLNGKKYSHYEINIWSGCHSPVYMTDGLNTFPIQLKPSRKIGNVSIFFDEDKSNFWAEFIFDPDATIRTKEEIIIQGVLSCSPYSGVI